MTGPHRSNQKRKGAREKMALTVKRVGAPITISIGRRGERPDFIPARLAGPSQVAYRNGRPEEVAPVITAQQNLAGETYLGERLHNLAFAFDRSEHVDLLDGTSDKPKTIAELVKEKQEATMAFMQSRPESAQVVDLNAIPEAE